MFVDRAEYIYIAMPMYNLIEYNDNYSDTSGSLWQFKRDEKAALPGKTANHNDRKSSVKDTKIVVPLKYLSNVWRSLEIPLIDRIVHHELD